MNTYNNFAQRITGQTLDQRLYAGWVYNEWLPVTTTP